MPHTSSSPLPPPPAGYRPAERFHYPKLALQVAAIVVLLLAAPLLLILTVESPSPAARATSSWSCWSLPSRSWSTS
jgi:hypothetical protein